jgi:hypothetical protein
MASNFLRPKSTSGAKPYNAPQQRQKPTAQRQPFSLMHVYI